jgi:phosphatidate cytidylyltransferase
MALDVQTFKTRSLTAVVFAALVVTGLCWNIYSFITLCLLILVGCLVEFYQLNRLIHTPGRIIRLFIPLVYLLLPIGLLLDLGITQTDTRYVYDPLLPCGIMFSIWINDTMAYLVGSLIGKTPLSAVSPKKTWEGTLGGILLSMAVIGGLGYGLPIANRYDPVEWILISAAAAVFGTIGDLLESKWKRMAGVKDSGRIMPGHGGFLDRFDSLLLATPAVWLLIHWLIA